jgi:hypothetical protein
MSNTEKEVICFKKYKTSLDWFIYIEMGNLKISQYMALVNEIERIKTHIEILKKSIIKIEKKEFSIN